MTSFDGAGKVTHVELNAGFYYLLFAVLLALLGIVGELHDVVQVLRVLAVR